uniref:IgGFc-binding protein n=1 Tax=Pelusios castaneus TaxID=367368 RepID=A0A8C8S399_9SAUR
MGFANIILYHWAWIFMLWSVSDISTAVSPEEVPDPSCSGPQGTEFITVFMQNYLPRYGSADLKLFITGYTPGTSVTVSVNKAGVSFDVKANPGEMTLVPIPPFVELSGSQISDHTVIIQANREISILSLNYKSHTADTTVVYPVKKLGNEYYVVTPVGSARSSNKQFAVVAWQDPTLVEVYLKGAVTFKEETYRAGSKLVIPLGAYQAVQLQSRDDLSGTRIVSQNPVAVYSGHMCVTKHTKCDYVGEQLLPVSSWGTMFIVPPLLFQSKFDLVFVAASQHTRIDYQSERGKSRKNLVAGQVVTFEIKTSNPLFISASAGIQVIFFSTGGTKGKIEYDPFLMMIPDISHYCETYNIYGQDMFENYGVIVAKTSDTADTTIDMEPLHFLLWRPIPGTAYSWTTYNMGSGVSNHTIENPSSPFGLLSIGIKDGAGYGSSAIGGNGISSITPTTQPVDLSSASCAGLQGTEFITVFMQNHFPRYGNGDFRLFITGYTPGTSVTVSVNKADFAVTITVNPEQTESVTIPAFVQLIGSSISSHSIIVQADHEISILSLNHKSYTADTTVVYPVQRLGKEYYVVTPMGKPGGLEKQFAVVAWKDPTTLQIHLKGDIILQGKTYKAGTELSMFLPAYKAIQIQSSGDLSGTRIVSQHPVAVYSGHVCALKHTRCDYVSEQLLPVSGWGTTFIVPPLSFQPKFDLVYVAASQYTHIDYLSGKVRVTKDLTAGQVVTIEIKVPNPLFISANAGIQVVFFCTGGTKGQITYDPFLLTIPDVSGYCQTYNIHGQDHYENYALITAKTSESGGITLDKEPLENIVWTPIPGTAFSWAEYNLGKRFKRQTMEHPSSPFGLLSIGIAAGFGYGSQAIGASSTLMTPCSLVLCSEGAICKVIDGEAECVPISSATCWAAGYLHYHTFDGQLYDIHGPCKYTVAKTCGCDCDPHAFEITAESRNRGNMQVSYIRSVTIQVDQTNVTVVRAEIGFVRVNNIMAHLPISLNNGALRLHQSGTSLVLSTDFNLRVSYDWNNHLRVTVPNDFSNNLCGLCGNYNKDLTDDFWSPDEEEDIEVIDQLQQIEEEQDENQVCWHSCVGGCSPCATGIVRKYKAESSCGLITKVSNGPFSQCHDKVDPTVYLENCVSDLCHSDGHRKTLCEALKTYADACQLEGVRIGEWRQLARCPMECPLENSQYQLCGTACPATCVDQSAPSSCQDPCVESCQCKDGFVLSQGKCIPKDSCGCLFEGRFYAPSESFWVSDACDTRCTCNAATRKVQCVAATCKHSERCGVVNGVRGCYPTSYATCSVTRNLHHVTFDGQRYDFQGTCRYQLTALCKKTEGLVDFEVSFQENSTVPVQIKVTEIDIKVNNQFPGKIMVNSFLINLPFSLDDQKITVYRKGWATVIQTDFGLSVTFAGWSGRTTVTLPVTYAGAVCGLCGNFNSDREDDLLMRDGKLAPNPSSFGQSWKVGELPGCSAVTIPPCASLQAIEKEQRVSKRQCGLILHKSGPFRECHSEVDPEGYFLDCVYGYCFLRGRAHNVCQAIASYAEACQEAGAMIHLWRTKTFCPPSCPLNSHYKLCSSSCDLTCSTLYAPVQCTSQCKEGCECDDGFVLSGDSCVPISQCGCLHRGLYYQAGETFHPSGSCEEQCVCQAGGEVLCKDFSCGAGEQCRVVDGIQKCHPFGSATCFASGHSHYLSFDGVTFDFQGTCTYILAKTCTDASHLTPFTINVEKEAWDSVNVSVAKLVSIQVYGITLTLLQKKQGLIMVDGVSHNLPVITANRRLQAYQHGTNIRVQTDFGLAVSYDLVYQVRVTIPQRYQGHTCGLCGHYSGQRDGKFLLPSGRTTSNVAAFGSAWEVQIPGVSCVDRCAGNSCPVCEERKKDVSKGHNYCGLLTDPNGPFATCHGTVSASVYLSNCLYDLCLGNGDTKILCQSIHSYVVACQEAGVTIQPWRNRSFCPMSCPVNSHYEVCTKLCSNTCAGNILDCPETCAEGCQCSNGFFDGQSCVTLESCGCFEHGRYYKPSETVLTNECQQSCTCIPTQGVTCKAHSCSTGEICRIRDGVIACIRSDIPSCSVVICEEGTICKMINGHPECVPISQATCWAGGYLHYHTFDGRAFDFHGACTYTMAKTCRNDSSLPSFHVTVKSENRGNMQVSYIMSVTVQVDGVTVTATRAEVGFVWVNDVRARLPISQNNDKLRLYQSGTFLILRTDFNLRVFYDWKNYLRVTVPRVFFNSLCGLCGNYNVDPADDFRTPSGNLAPNVAALGAGWAVEDEDQFCWHDCIGGCRPCAISIGKKYKEEDSCGLITKVSNGPFSQCHDKVKPTVYLDNCVYDLCRHDGYRQVLCEALKAYADACQLEGVRIGEWRELARCPMECPPENSQYQLCGTACPATCVDQSVTSSCEDPCLESCQCKDGFVLSQGKCIPKGSCGCLFEGHFSAPSESFWVDEACGTRCTCSAASRQVQCVAAACKRSERCGLVNGVRGCYPTSYATCSVTRNLHYATFDGWRYDFQGTCRYQLTALCKKTEGLVDFGVYFQGSSTAPVQIKVYKTDIRVSNQFPGKIMVNNFLINLPFNLDDKKITLERKGWATVIQTDFGLSVTFAGWSGRTTVTLPVTYAGAVCGLCGNFNSDREDDLLMRDGKLAPNPSSFGQSWKVGELPGCSAVTIPPCASLEAIEKEQRVSKRQCGLILHKSGPFRGCHSKVDPQGYFIDCVYAYCVLTGRKSNVCQAIAGYAEACQEAGAVILPWRTETFCSPSCPPNSHYEFCSSSCDLTCSTLYAPVQCTSQCKEGCECDDGFVLSGDSCVPVSQCGCLHRGLYYQAGETFHPSGSCEEQCVCQAGGEVVCKAFSCSAGEECGVVNGIQKCHPFGSATCFASGHSHYLSFDGVPFDFQGTCNYILAKTCTSASHLTPFTVSVEKEAWGSGNVSVAKLVSIQVYGIKLTLLQKKQGLTMVNGMSHNLPVIVADGRLRAYQHGVNIVVQTDFGFTVSYDLVYQVRVTIPGSYEGQTCGLCGNYNGQQEDEFLLPDGRTAPDAAAFGSAWEVQIPGTSCVDSCAGNSCLICTENKKDVFRGRNSCGLLTDSEGPFAACHGTVNPSVYLSNCLYDVCLHNGDTQVLCQTIHSYVTACQEARVFLQPWRIDSFCPVSCPVNSHHEICTDLCTSSCTGEIMDCPGTCAEGCQCDDSFFFDGRGCVALQSCGCFEHGRYYQPNETVLANECQQSCTCIPAQGVTCKAHSCTQEEICQIREGVMACISKDIPKPPCSVVHCKEGTICKMINGQPECVPISPATCWAGGYLYYHTFDGRAYDFHGVCTYTMAKTCRDDSSLPSFHVTIESEPQGNMQVSSIESVTVQVDGITVTASRAEVGFVWVNNIRAHLPISLNNGTLRLYQSGTSLVLRTDFKLRVSYDWNNYVRVAVPRVFLNSLCGLCGNYNGDPADDFQTPSGNLAPTVAALGASWAVEDEDQFCWHDCTGSCRPCATNITKKYKEEDSCGLITKVSDGPFTQCHTMLDPTVYLDNCVSGLCHHDGYRKALCEALKAYADACQLEGVRIAEWRELARCPMECPLENSQYQLCGTACPATCVDQSVLNSCEDPCVESCQCKDGFVLSQGKCIPKGSCGCLFEGRLYALNESFWVNEACGTRCICNAATREVQCVAAECKHSERCELVNGVRGCYPTSYSTCSVTSNLHYTTFDGQRYDFQGTCRYQLTALCKKAEGLVDFRVYFQENNTAPVQIKVYQTNIRISNQFPGKVLVNGVLKNLPFNLDDKKITLQRKGWATVIQTDFGLSVTFAGWSGRTTVTLPVTYAGAVCGLCGNFNSDREDDLLMRDGKLAPNPSSFGQSWKVGELPGCSAVTIPPCASLQAIEKEQRVSKRQCGLILHKSGPFRGCHSKVDPQGYFIDCVYAYCFLTGRKSNVCQAIAGYAEACQEAGAVILPWRTEKFCSPSCPPNTHYEFCSSSCDVTCSTLYSPVQCTHECKEGCDCDDGFILSGDSCVPVSQCGCLHRGLYYEVGETFHPSSSCKEQCMCQAGGVVICKAFSCSAGEECGVVDGVQKCHPFGSATCFASGHPHYLSFDGVFFDFQGTCTYILAKTCTDASHLTPFTVSIEKEDWGSKNISVAKVVSIQVYGITLTLLQNKHGLIMVDGVSHNLPVIMVNGRLQVYQHGTNVLVQTDFGLTVSYDLVYQARVTIPGSYKGQMCGLCGNYNGQQKGEFLLPEGRTVPDVAAFGSAWEVQIPGTSCVDRCAGNSCPVCEERKKDVYKGQNYCGRLTDPNGPLAACHDTINPSVYLSNCLYDVCLHNGDTQVLCQSIHSYVTACQEARVFLQSWRSNSFCPVNCPVNSHYEVCTELCSTTCAGDIMDCRETCAEGCQCDFGFFFNGQSCVTLESCGCFEHGRYYKPSEMVLTNECQQSCTCVPARGIICNVHSCSTRETCQIRDGVMACVSPEIPKPSCSVVRCKEGTICKMINGKPECVPISPATCWAGGYLHYHTFDGRAYDFHGNCTYTVARTCGEDSGLPSFHITAKNENRGNTQVSYIESVTSQVDGITITVARAEVGFVWVDNIRAHLPISLNNGALRLYQSGTSLVLRTNFNLSMSYDWNNYMRVTIPNIFYGNLCGLCGNYNGDASDDFRTPTGNLAPTVTVLGAGWAVEAEEQFCWHDCIGGCKPCAASIAKKYKEEAFCGLITKVSDGPFSQCHTKVDPTVYLDNCVYDLCHNDGFRKALCEALKAYADACQLEGIRIGEWRELARCPMECPLENSQYQLCGTACPATCVDQSVTSSCQEPCVESCQCKDGFVLSQGKCISKDSCGCLFEGRFFAPSESFWVDETCETQCVCNAATRQVQCVAAACKRSESCQLVNGVRGCYPASYATCSVTRNLHYTTFDGQRYNFQGTCRYQLTALCKKTDGLVDFEVYFQENNTTLVQIQMYQTNIRISNQFPGKVLVNGFLINLPFSLDDQKITVYRKGWATVIQTDFGLSVTFAGWSGRTTVTLPVTYAGAVCGLCGNFNSDREDDLLMRDGKLAPNPSSFGQSWKVGELPGCSAVMIPPCASLEAIEKEQRVSGGQCGLILHKSGPFRGCHSKVDPQGYFVDCVYAYCFLSGRERNICQAIAGYAEACQEAGATIHSWRTTKFCSPSCPLNSHYEFCGAGCDLTCSTLYAPVQCTSQCKEGCVCDDSFVLSGESCVPISQCGCLHRGLYYQAGETFHPNGSCKEQCVCQAGGVVICKAFSCSPEEECKVVEGIQKCHVFEAATCSASGHPHYLSFDGVPFDFQGTCTYTLAKTCTDASRLTPFTVSVEKDSWGSGIASVAKLVSIQVYGTTLTLLQKKQELIMVDGVSHMLPVIMADGHLQAYQHGTNVLVQTSFGLIVSYDLVYQVRVTIPGNYHGQMCGLCGNYKGQQDDEFLLPDGRAAHDTASFGSAWEVQVPKATCTDQCAGNSCPVCEEGKKDVFKEQNYCGLLTDPDGPFVACHDTVSPRVYLSNCLYDVCLGNGDTQVLCQSIHSYVTACQEAGVSIRPWRSESFCPLSCPTNSHYKICANLCATTCARNVMKCPETCAEGCQCDDGFFSDGQGCVAVEKCGCFDHGRYYKPRETVLRNDCQQSCTCEPLQGVSCKAHSCTGEETCGIRDGIMGCIGPDHCKVLKCRTKETCKIEDGQESCVPNFTGVCLALEDMQYQTFDGLKFDLKSTCKYTVAKYCGNDSTLVPFTIVEKNGNEGSQDISFLQVTNIYVYGYNISIYKREVGKVRLNNVITNLPVSLEDGKISLYQSGLSTALQTDFGLQVAYDKHWNVAITLPSSYYGATCGLCGNFNQNPEDDMMSSSGIKVSIESWASSWKVHDRDPFCWDYCQGNCPMCDESKMILYGGDNNCGVIIKPGGIFRDCHSRVSPDDFFENCIIDMCLNEADKRILCEALGAYADACRKQGVTVDDWRIPSGCDACITLKCRTKETCETEDGLTECVPNYSKTCLGSNDTHYQTFDGLEFDFQGTCTYTLAEYCGSDATLEPFKIDEKNDKASQDISYLRMTNIDIYGYNISIYKKEVGKIRLNGVITSLPVTLKEGKIRVFRRGLSTVLQTDVGLRVGYDRNWRVSITLPSSYYGAMCGLCGNFNENPDDDKMSSKNSKVSSVMGWESTWKVQDRDPFCWDYCQETCPMCEQSKRELYGDDSHCGVISKVSGGPFRECHSKVSPDDKFDNCLYDVCMNKGNKAILCRALEDYADDCMDQGVTVYDWRTLSSCDDPRESCDNLKCKAKETCKTEDGRVTCVPDFVGTCWGWGDSHYHTFDGLKFDFQGNCTYTIAKYYGHDSSLVPFTVDEKNDNRGSQAISFLRVINIYVYGYNISIFKREVGQVQLNGVITSLPVTLKDGKIRLYQSGLHAVLQTDFGLRVAYNWNWHLVISLPSSYYGATCGLCGNFNQNPEDDMTSSNGIKVSSIVGWAASWKVPDQDAVCSDSCQENCLTCDESKMELYRGDSHCGLISKAPGGPFRECHSRVNPKEFFDSCVYDVCLNGGATSLLCQALEAYTVTCRDQGVTIYPWRTPSRCALSCPENSHYESCGSACPASCSKRTTPSSCKEPCVETCQCNDGYVLSVDKCVPVGSCGCDYNGRYYKPNEEFWDDENCHFRCRCDPSLGTVVCKETSCKAKERCSVVNGVRGCHAIGYSTCIGTGDPHYTTFDGKKYDFMGTCIYQFAALCSEDPTFTPFNVKVENNNRGSKTVSFTKTVILEVYNVTISLSQDHPRKIKVDGVFVDLPFSHQNKFKAYISGVHGFIQTDFDLRVSFDWYSYARVIIPNTYADAVCGLCGNANQNPNDDLTMKDGTQTSDEIRFADSWKVGEVPGCSSSCIGDCSICSEAQKQPYKGQQYCGILTQENGPFHQCYRVVDRTPFLDDCLYDTCQYKGQRDALCNAISAYVVTCQARGIQIGQWRSASFCELTCPSNSHYELCGISCPTSCHDQWAPGRCEKSCAEGCFCDAGFTLSGDKCVPVAQCGCVHQGRYYAKGEEFYTNASCQDRCQCRDNGVVRCQETSCGVNEECMVKNGALGCHAVGYGTCIASGGPHYISFDGRAFDFQGSCTYTLAKVCSSDPRLENFSVVVEKESSAGGYVTATKRVVVAVHGYTVTMERGRTWKVAVGGELYILPLATDDGKLWINQEGNNIIIQSASGLQVFYDTASYLLVTVPSTYKEHVCGLCGNFNDDKNDDLPLPSVKSTQKGAEFAALWKVPVDGTTCSDDCGERCPICDAVQMAPYQAESSCGLITAASGPFGDCHSLISPAEYFNHCLYDMCAANGMRETLCQSLQAYVAACQVAGAKIGAWRTASFCPFACPTNSYYKLCTRSCDFTCASLFAPARCTGKCFEGCSCDSEYVSDGEACVPMDRCGCVSNGRYIKARENFVSTDCSEKCTCHASGMVDCEETKCTEGEKCMLSNGVRSCVEQEGRCLLAPGTWFTSFDGLSTEVLLEDDYEVTSLCDGIDLPWFRVVVRLFRAGGLAVPEGIYAFFSEGLITVNKQMEIWVRGVARNESVNVSSTLSIHKSQGTIMIVKASTVKILFNPSGGEVTVTVSNSLANKLCALCGNFNGDSSDDLQLRDGTIVKNITLAFESWKARDFSRSEP